jgi:hypothetical protein
MSRGSGRLPNHAVSPPHSAVTARAYCGTHRAVGRAGYRERCADTERNGQGIIGFGVAAL